MQIPQEILAFSQGMAHKANANLHQRCPQLKPELGAPTPTQTGVPPLKTAIAAVFQIVTSILNTILNKNIVLNKNILTFLLDWEV